MDDEGTINEWLGIANYRSLYKISGKVYIKLVMDWLLIFLSPSLSPAIFYVYIVSGVGIGDIYFEHYSFRRTGR